MIVLDTHAWLWHVDADDRALSRAARGVLADDAELLVSAISVWEVGMLVAKGRLRRTPGSPGERRSWRTSTGRDPADRLIVATALQTGGTLVTKDRSIRTWGRRNGLTTVW